MSSRIIIGKHAVRQCLSSDQHIEKLYLRERQRTNDDLKRLISLAKKKGIQTQWLEPHRFDQRFSGEHQGVACITHSFEQRSIDEIITETPRVILMADHIQDPHNFGACMRSAAAFGVDAVIIPQRGQAPLSETVHQVSCGGKSVRCWRPCQSVCCERDCSVCTECQ